MPLKFMRVVLVLTLLTGTWGGVRTAWAGEPATCTEGVCPLHRVKHRQPRFDAATVTTVTGRVERVVREDHGGWEGVHLELTTDSGPLKVALGPALFVDLYARFAAADVVTVTGSKVTHDGATLLLTTSIARGTDTVELRTSDGQPLF